MGMFIERLLNQGSAPLLEQTLRFTAARHRLIAENVVNVDTPGYRQKDLSVEKFQALLRERVDDRRDARPGDVGVRFDDVAGELESPRQGILFHDGNNRSMEQLMADQAKNAMMHNLVIELLRKQFEGLELALKERVG
jgi:flagellar basal-body rod protein FlgB